MEENTDNANTVPPAADLLLNRIKRCDKWVVKDAQTIIMDTGENAICGPYDTVALHNRIAVSPAAESGHMPVAADL